MEKCMTSVFKKIASKIADIFNIFDFSFVISGFTAFVVIYIFLLFTDIVIRYLQTTTNKNKQLVLNR